MNVQAILFQDAMDPTRFLKIKEEKPNSVVCKVFFGPTKEKLIFHGTVELPKRLFYPDGFTRIGFNVARDPEPVKPRRDFRDHDDRDERDDRNSRRRYD